MDSDFRPVRRPAKSVKATPTPPDKTAEPFQTPYEAAAADDIAPDTSAESNADPAPAETPQRQGGSWRDKLRLHWPPGKKEYITAAIIVLLLAGGAAGYLLTRHDEPAPAPVKKTQKAVPKPTTVPSTLSGLPVDPSVNQRPVTGVMIENSQEARPQSGLGEASVVFEAIAEGGITRFLALFQDTQPSSIGPVRSARPYYLQWVLGFNAGYAHVGGSPEALADIKSWGVRDLDQFYNSGAYQRVSSRAAPHNVYTSIDALQKLETSKGWGTSTFTGFLRKPEAPVKQAAPARTVDIKISGPLYNVHYDYDAATNSYQRSEGGAPHIDANTNKVISPKVVVALVMPYSLESDGYHSSYQTIGSGPAVVFQDGISVSGTWTKKDNTSQFTFSDSAGKPLALNPGQTWLTAVSSAAAVTSGP